MHQLKEYMFTGTEKIIHCSRRKPVFVRDTKKDESILTAV